METKTTPLKDYLDNIRSGSMPAVKDRLIQACFLENETTSKTVRNSNRVKFGNWMRGVTEVPVLAQKKINEVTRKTIYKDV
ncbi:MAG: hypothetical protein LBS50_08255 [Prevotellaceae bacterium]|jgi:hypothetical protein|nr:hypothetical protein [Prevotellaceae bacterium]